MGPTSYIWDGFVDPETFIATYSIEIARSTILSSELGATQIPSNITFGKSSEAIAYYAGK